MLKSLGLWKQSEQSDSRCTSSNGSGEAEGRFSIPSERAFESSPHGSSPNSVSLSTKKEEREKPDEERLIEKNKTGGTEREDEGGGRERRDVEDEELVGEKKLRETEDEEDSSTSKEFSLIPRNSTDESDEDETLTTKASSVISFTKDSSLISTTPKDSILSQTTKDTSTLTPSSTNTSIQMQGGLPLQISDIHYTLPYMESYIDESLTSEDQELTTEPDSVRRFSVDSSLISHDPRSTLSSKKSQIYASPVKENFPYSREESNQERISRHSHPSLASYQEPLQAPTPPYASVVSAGSRFRKNERNPSVLSCQFATSRKTSLMVVPGHRRQLSEGSRVSFQESSIPLADRRPSQFRKHSLASHSVYSGVSSLSGSLHLGCHNIDFKKLRDFKKPNLQDIKAQFRKLPDMAKDR